MTDNVAEYEGLLAAAQWLQDEGIEEKLVVKGDSQLVIKQMTGVWKINSATDQKAAGGQGGHLFLGAEGGERRGRPSFQGGL